MGMWPTPPPPNPLLKMQCSPAPLVTYAESAAQQYILLMQKSNYFPRANTPTDEPHHTPELNVADGVFQVLHQSQEFLHVMNSCYQNTAHRSSCSCLLSLIVNLATHTHTLTHLLLH